MTQETPPPRGSRRPPRRPQTVDDSGLIGRTVTNADRSLYRTLLSIVGLAPEGGLQIAIGTALYVSATVTVMTTFHTWVWVISVTALTLLWAWSVAFFRDPRRAVDHPTDVLCAPADGTVRDITEIADASHMGGPAVRIGMFLSLFNVHINRSPCDGRVRETHYNRGLFLAAMKPEAADVNESNTLVIEPDPPMAGPIVVKQIAGMAARRIVCHAGQGTLLKKGERFGLIKYGSRTELTVPSDENVEILVRIGDKVKAGVTPMIRLPITQLGNELAHERCRENGTPISASA